MKKKKELIYTITFMDYAIQQQKNVTQTQYLCKLLCNKIPNGNNFVKRNWTREKIKAHKRPSLSNF